MLAAIFMAHPGEWLTAAEIEREAGERLTEIARRGGKIYELGRDRMPYYVALAISLMQTRRFIEEQDGRYRLNAEVEDIIAYYANSVWPDSPEDTARRAPDSERRQTYIAR